MESREEEEIKKALSEQMEDMEFESIPETENSPINEPVKSGEVSTRDSEPAKQPTSFKALNDGSFYGDQMIVEESENLEEKDVVDSYEPLDAPEQAVDLSEEDVLNQEPANAPKTEIPDSHVGLAADSLLGVTNNVLEIGGGFFVKIKKTKEILAFEEAIRIVDNQNKRNIQRIKLDEEDQALLRPILIQVLKNRAEELTPEQQLVAAAISILLKKAQLMAEIRSENKELETNIIERIRAEISEAKQEKEEAHEIWKEQIRAQIKAEMQAIKHTGTVVKDEERVEKSDDEQVIIPEEVTFKSRSDKKDDVDQAA